MSEPLSNSERLMLQYDPAYVRRVETLNGGAPVQVCLESRMLRDELGTGVAMYARMLAGCLAQAGASPLLLEDGTQPGGPSRHRALRWLSATRTGARAAVARDGDDQSEAAQWIVRDIFREAQVFFNLHGRLLPIAFEKAPEVMHWTYPVPLYVVGAKNLYTIHDLIPLTDPGLTPIPSGRYGRMIEQIAAHAHMLVTVSESIRTLVIERLGMAPSRVVNTYQAVAAPLQVDPPLSHGLRSGRYFLFCGRVEGRKNLDRLASAHAASGSTLPLVIVGPETPGEEALEGRLRACANVIRLHWLPRTELLGLMRRARALLFPSLAEGFGLPIAEAMIMGCPVLTSDRGAAAEVAGGAALLVAPEDDDAIARAIARLDGDDRLCTRLRAAGFAQGRQFTPETYARRLRALYAQALASAAPCAEPFLP